jgi:hypothetical protein
MSIDAHGGSFGIVESGYDEDMPLTSLALANSILACINLVTTNWMKDRKTTGIKEIYRELGLLTDDKG